MKYLVSLFALLFSVSIQAGEIVKDPETVKAMFSDKTFDAYHLKRETSWANYFAPDGSMKRVTEDGEKQTGKWYINDDAKHCIKWDHKNKRFCRSILKGKRDGVHFRVKFKGERMIKLVRFKNPRNGNDLPK
jgi:hypothetical protein